MKGCVSVKTTPTTPASVCFALGSVLLLRRWCSAEEAEAARRRLKDMEDRKARLTSRPTTAVSGGQSSAASAADRPFTAPAVSSAAGFNSGPSRPGTSGGVERSSTSATTGAASPDSDCQPNQLAPLLRDEKGRREWVEGELEAHCSSFELQVGRQGSAGKGSPVRATGRGVLQSGLP